MPTKGRTPTAPTAVGKSADALALGVASALRDGERRNLRPIFILFGRGAEAERIGRLLPDSGSLAEDDRLGLYWSPYTAGPIDEAGHVYFVGSRRLFT